MTTDMLTREQAEAMVAEALRMAADLPPFDGDGDPAGPFDHHIFVKRDAILALIPDAGAALDRAIETAKRLPGKPGLRSYEHVRCLIFVNGDWEIGMWNCEHLCWDDDEGDDFRYDPTVPTHWMPLPPPPARGDGHECPAR